MTFPAGTPRTERSPADGVPRSHGAAGLMKTWARTDTHVSGKTRVCQSCGDLAAPTVSSRPYLVVVVHLHHVPLAVAHAAGDVRRNRGLGLTWQRVKRAKTSAKGKKTRSQSC